MPFISKINGSDISASYAVTASYALTGGSGGGAVDTGSLVTTSSFNAFTSSINTFTSSYNTGSFSGSFTGSFLGTASWAFSASNAINARTASFLPVGTYLITASWAQSASNAINAQTASFLPAGTYQITSSWAIQALTSSYAEDLRVSGSISGANFIDFNTQYTIGTNEPTWKEGRLFYDSGSGALAFYNWEQDITLNIGQESWLRARNATGVTITNGSVVKLLGAVGDRPTIALAQSTDQTNTFSTGNEIIGMATHDIENGTDGFVTTFGLVNGLNTAAFTAGDILWVSQSAGQFTNVPPPTPYDRTFVGIVTRANVANGSVFMTPLAPIHFHDISSVSASIYQQGDLWMYRSGSAGLANAWINTKTLGGDYTISGSLTLTGSLTTNDGVNVQTITASFISASGGITGSLFGTASWATNALTASLAPNYVLNSATSSFAITGSNSFRGSQSITGSLVVSGSGVTIELYGDKIIVGTVGGDEGGEILLGKPVTNTTLTGSGVTIDSYQNKIRFFEQGGAARGAYIDITACGAGVSTNLSQDSISLINNTNVQISTTVSYISFCAFTTNSVEAARQIIVPVAGSIKNLYVLTSTSQPAGGPQVCTVRKNGANTSLTVSISAGAAAGTFSDTTNSVSVAAGDKLSLQISSSVASSATIVSVAAIIERS